MIVLLDKLMLALKAVQEYFNIELKKFSEQVQDDLKLTKDELSESQDILDSFINETKTDIDSTKEDLNSTKEDLNSTKEDLNSTKEDLNSTKEELNDKMNSFNPVGTGSFSMNRRPESEIGQYSHAVGNETEASGECSHAEGFGTIANGRAQHVQGELNIEDIVTDSYERSKYAHIVGNGSRVNNEDVRSNAHTLDWNGVGWFQGGLQVGGNAQDDGAKNVLLEGVAVNNIILKDIINGYEYIIDMQNGNLVSSCKLGGIQVSTMPTKTNYIEGEAFDKTGMIVTAIYQDGTTKIIDNYTCDEGVLSGKDITISYEEYDIVCTTTISANNFTVMPFDPSIHLIDFDYTENADGTYTITGWKQTLNGEPSTEMIVPNITFIVV